RVGPLRAAGATVVRCPTRAGRVDLGFLLGELFAREVQGVLVEGGGEVHAAFLDAGIVDRVAVFVAPLLVGGRTAPSVVGGAGGGGASAAVNGAWLTVGERREEEVVAGRGPGTPARTTLGRLEPGGPVNLERPLRFGGALGGHLVLGHVDGVGTVEEVTRV